FHMYLYSNALHKYISPKYISYSCFRPFVIKITDNQTIQNIRFALTGRKRRLHEDKTATHTAFHFFVNGFKSLCNGLTHILAVDGRANSVNDCRKIHHETSFL